MKINRIYFDRGFFDSKSIETSQRHHVKYLIPCTENPRIKKILTVISPPTILKDYDMKNTRFNVAIVKDENNQCRAFATNIDFNEDEVGLSDRFFICIVKDGELKQATVLRSIVSVLRQHQRITMFGCFIFCLVC